MNSAFVIGELMTVGVAYFCLESLTSGNWRLLLVWYLLNFIKKYK